MTLKNFIIKVSEDVFAVSFIVLMIFSFFEWLEPGFVSFYINFVWLLMIPLVSGIITIISKKT